MRILTLFAVFLLTLSACTHKPKPISKDISKTVVNVNGKTDSVTNNPKQNYGTATVPDVCTKTLLTIIQATSNFKHLTAGKNAKDIIYVVNWVKAETPVLRDNGSNITNGVELVVNEKGSQIHRLGAYIYNNEDAALYYNTGGKYLPLTGTDSLASKKLRNGCYWGVASHK